MFQSPHLAQLKELQMVARSGGRDILTTVFDPATSQLKNLTHLDLSFCQLSPSALQTISASPLLTKLTTLKLNVGKSTQLEFDQIVTRFIARNPRLEHIHLFANQHRETPLTSFPTNLKLKTFMEARVKMDSFSTSPCLSQLEVLELHPLIFHSANNDDRADETWSRSFQQFIQSPNLSKLTHLTIPLFIQAHHNAWQRNNSRLLRPVEIVSLFTSPMMSNDLVNLTINMTNNLTDDVIEKIFTARVDPDNDTSPLKFGKLEKLTIVAENLTSRSVDIIAQNLPQLTHLSLPDSSQLDDDAIAAIIGNEHHDPRYPYPALPNLHSLELANCLVTDQGLIHLSKSQLLDQFETLSIWSDGITHLGSKALLTTPLFSNMKSIEIFHPDFFNRPDCESLDHLKECEVDLRDNDIGR